MQSFVFILVVGLSVIASATEPIPACFKTTDECAPVVVKTKEIFGKLRSIQGTEASDIINYVKELHELFHSTLQAECNVERCYCNSGKLECSNVRDNIRNLLLKVELPECIKETPVATKLFQRLSKAVQEGNRPTALSVLNLLENVTLSTVKKGENTKMVECIGETIQRIRAPIREKIQSFDFKENCDFCKA